MFDQLILVDGAPAAQAARGAAGGEGPSGVVGGDGAALPVARADAVVDVSQLSAHPTGPALAAVLDLLDLAALGDHDLIEALVASARQHAAAEARLQQALAEVAARQDSADGDIAVGTRGHRWEFAADQVAAALGMTPGAAANRLGHASRLCRDLPATLAALAAGAIDGYKARILADEVETLLVNTASSSLDPALAVATVEARVLPRAGGQTPAQLRAAVRRAVLRADPAAADHRHEKAKTERSVRVWPLPDGMAALQWTDTAPNILGLYAAVDALVQAAKTPGDDRSAEQRRADTLTDLGHRLLDAPGPGGLGEGGLSQGQRARAQLQLVVPVGLLLGLTGGSDRDDRDRDDRDRDDRDRDDRDRDDRDRDDRDRDGGNERDRDGGNERGRGGGEERDRDGGEDPAELARYGPIPPALAREIAADAEWTRILTDPVSGAVLDVGRTRYRPPAALARFVRARDRFCCGIGCRVPADRADLDHNQAFPAGPTAAGNLTPKCRRHHGVKQHPLWHVEHDQGGATWTTPTGHAYRVERELLPGAVPPRPLTEEQLRAVAEAAARLGLTLDTDTESDTETIMDAEPDAGAGAGTAGTGSASSNAPPPRVAAERPPPEDDRPPF